MSNKLWLPMRGLFTIELERDGKIIKKLHGHNSATTAGKNHLLETEFGGGTQVTTWYIGLINNSPTPTLLAADTLASHTGWSEIAYSTGYTGNRLEWVDAAAASGSKGTTSATTFPMLGAYDVYGMFICSVATTTTGTLWSTGAFSEVTSVINGDNLKVTYTLSL